ncbi:MAG TPA: hypothetical protein VF483_07640, partial [Gemmatimonadaceae bacterium]
MTFRGVVAAAMAVVALSGSAVAQKALCGPAAEFEKQLAFVGRILSAQDSASAAFRQRWTMPVVDSSATRA